MLAIVIKKRQLTQETYVFIALFLIVWTSGSFWQKPVQFFALKPVN